MDPLTILFGVLGIAIALAAWLWPRQPQSAPPVGPSDDRPDLLVSLTHGMLTFPVPPHVSEVMAFVEVANRSSTPYRLVNVGLNLENRKNLFFTRPTSNPALPCILRETENFGAWESYRSIGHALIQAGTTRRIRVRGFVTDSYNKQHFSGWFEIDPQDWASRAS